MTEARSEVSLLVVFIDLLRYSVQSQRVTDVELADVMDRHYERVAAAIALAGGRLVKFVGDGALVVFPAEAADTALQALLELKPAIDAFFEQRGWDCRANVKVHFGSVVAGPFGAAGDKRFDLLGKTVNTTAMLTGSGVTLSVEAFRRLGPELRRRFKKHSAPITYIRAEDPRRSRWDR